MYLYKRELKLIRIVISLILFTFLTIPCFSGDSHNDSQSHKVVYTLVDSAGNPVSGQTVNLTVQRASDGAYLDFNNNQFAQSGWTTLNQSMSYDSRGGFYWRVVTIDNANAVFSSDYVCVISNDNATYGDQQSEVVNFDITNNLIKINR